ncbi:MAG: GNAT family N-acetyltransferase [Eubacteriales bacterium]|nr:GNAT family N-acetyltransferase [Eubacteriales bacterium]
MNIKLLPLEANDREQFIVDNQWAFKYGAMIEFGERDNRVNADGEIISRKTIERSIDAPDNVSYRIICDDKIVGGVILKIDKITHHNHLEILFVLPEEHTKGIGYSAWKTIEKMYPETKTWETCTPYFEKRNIHFYVNKCGFQIDQFWCEHFTPSNSIFEEDDEEGPTEMFRFVKIMK